MQIIDKNGKILGIINIIDLTVLLFLTSTITGISWLVYTGELFKDHDYKKKIYTDKTIEIEAIIETHSELEAIKKIMHASQKSEFTSLKILNITTEYLPANIIEKKKHFEIIKKNTLNLKATIILKTLKDYYTGIYYYNYHPIQINSTIQILDTKHNNSDKNEINITARIIKIF